LIVQTAAMGQIPRFTERILVYRTILSNFIIIFKSFKVNTQAAMHRPYGYHTMEYIFNVP